MLTSQFQAVGRDLCARGLVSSHGGNLSVKIGDNLLITHRGCMLGCLEERDLVETGISKNDRATPLASVELAVHRAIYQKTSASAIVHAHPAHAVALSFAEREIKPCDLEGSLIMPKVPVLGWDTTIKPGEFGTEIAEALRKYKIVLVRSHGSFAVGQLLEEAYHYTTTLEQSCRLLYLLKTLKINKRQRSPRSTKRG